MNLPAKPAAPPLLIYDGHCVLCTGLLGWLLPRIPTGALEVLPCTAPAALPYLQRAQIDPAAPASVLLVDGDELLTEWAVAERLLPLTGRAGACLAGVLKCVPKPLKQPIYRLLATHRYRLFGRHEMCVTQFPRR